MQRSASARSRVAVTVAQTGKTVLLYDRVGTSGGVPVAVAARGSSDGSSSEQDQ